MDFCYTLSVPAIFEKLVSGGQTGVDRAALDAALELGIPCGGWCPKGRLCENGTIPFAYPLKETPTAEYAQRTEWNVRDSSGTLVITEDTPGGGTALTIEFTRRYGKPCLVIDLKLTKAKERVLESIRTWIAENDVRVLNVAGPRESTAPGIYEKTRAFLRYALAHLAAGTQGGEPR